MEITELQMEIIRRIWKGVGLKQIAKELNIPERTIRRVIESMRDGSLQAKYNQILEWIIEIEAHGLLDEKMTSESWAKLAQLGRERRLQAGYRPSGRPPFGYKFSNGNLVVDHVKARVVRRIFKRWIEGETMYQLGKETGLHRNYVRHILRNPVYIGKFCYGDKVIEGKHEPLIDEKTWNDAQPSRIAHMHGTPPFGYRRKIDGLAVEPREAEKVRRMFELRLNGKSINEISKEIKLPTSAVEYMLQNPVYAGVNQFRGEFIKGNHEPVISLAIWKDAQRVSRISIQQYKAISEAGQKRGLTTRNEILEVLAEGPAGLTEIANKINVCAGTVYFWLHRHNRSGLVGEGLVDRQPERFGKYFLKSSSRN
jgi:DNA invertase Pin-like site-specific DNA recombinase